MKRSNVDVMFIDETKKKRKIILYVALITIVSAIIVFFTVASIRKGKTEYVNYKENSSIDYRVYLKENDFYKEKYLGKDSEYIASLIDYISAKFNYDISLEEKGVDFTYTRRIDAIVEVYDLNGKKPLYKITEQLLDSKSEKSNSQTNVSISEDIKIDYNHYNNLVTEFKDTYQLGSINSFLTIKMYVDIKGSCKDLIETPDTQSEISLKIPLTTKIMSIELESNLVENKDGLLLCKEAEYVVLWWMIIAVSFVVDLYLLFSLISFIKKNRTARDIYKRELKKILNNYHSFIQKVNSDFSLVDYQIVRIDTFTDMLEIRDTIQQPILMVENKDKTGVHFIIPSNTKLLYAFSLKEEEIAKQIEK